MTLNAKSGSRDIADYIYSTNDNGAPDGTEHPEASHRPFPLDNCWYELNVKTMRMDEPLFGRPIVWVFVVDALAAGGLAVLS